MNRSRVTGDLASQGNIFVDIANDRVGIGSTIPTQKLDVTGTVIATTFSGSGANLTNLNGSNIASGTVPVARIGTGTKNTSTFYRGDGTFQVVNTDLSADTSPELGANLSTNGNFIQFPDSTTGNQNKAVFGGGLDLQIYHDGSHSYIHDGGTGNLKVRSNNFRISNADESKMSATFQPAGAVELYHNHSKKLETTSGGVTVSDNLTLSGGNIYLADTYKLMVGTGDDLQIHHDNSNTLNIINSQNGNLRIQHGGTTKLQVLSSGIDVVGTVTADNQIVLNSGDSTPARIDLYCEVSNAHYTRLQAPAHSTFSGNVTVTIPNTSGNLAVLANAADNRVVTATGTHAMTGETNLTWDATTLKVQAATPVLEISGTNSNGGNSSLHFNANANHWVLEADNYTQQNIFSIKEGTTSSSTPRLSINASGQTIIDSSGTEGGTNTRLAVCATGSPGSNPSSILDNTIATFRATGATAHAASIAILAGNTGSSAVHFGDTDNDIIGRLLYNHTSGNTSDYFEFFLQGSRRFRIQGNGNLCIGNDSNFTAGAKVEIRDTIGGGGGTGLILNDIGSSGATEGLHIEWRSGSDKQADQCRIGQSSNATGSGSNFFIATNSADSGSSTTRLTVQSDGTIVTGNVSIPTSSDIGNIYIKNASAIGSQSHQINYVSNAYFNGAWKYINSSLGATMITVNQNGYTFQTAGSGTANNNITFSNKFNIASTGAIAFSGAYGSSGQVLTSQGSSSAPTWTSITGTTINSNADNRVITGSGTANTLNGESSLTFDGSTLIVAGTNGTTHSNVDQLIVGSTSGTNGITIKSGTSSFGCLYFHDEDTTNAPKGQIEYQHGTEQMSFYANQELMMRIDGDEDEGRLSFTPNVVFSGSRNSNVINETVMFATSESSGNGHHDNHTMTFGQTNGNWSAGTSGGDSSFGLMWHYSTGASATRQLRAGIHYDHAGTEQFKIWSSYGDIVFKGHSTNSGNLTAEECNMELARFDANGHFVPGANNGRDLGTSSLKWRNIYVMDMHFSNEGGSPNSVDGTTGNWTLQEGADGIYMINNKNGKKYEMMLKEVQ